jgi:hypothetical protein
VATRNISISEAKQIDMVNFLKTLGHTPKKIRNNDHWFLSPLREEKTPSFKVNRQLNVWYDHGTGEGGNLIDFGIRYFKCSVTELLQKLPLQQSPGFSFHPHSFQPAGEKKKTSHEAGKIRIISNREISNHELQEYLNTRQIPLTIASQFCEEVSFELYHKKHIAIGFKNDSGGYELRNQYFKGSSTPKEPRLILQNDSKDLAVFEGFFSFLSFQTIQQSELKDLIDLPTIQADALVLNSVSFFEKSRERMEQYSNIHLFLDRDRMGIKCTQQALQWSSKYKDQSRHYQRFKDLNDCLIKSVNPELKQSHRRGRHL